MKAALEAAPTNYATEIVSKQIEEKKQEEQVL
jgi:hypothetical protein